METRMLFFGVSLTFQVPNSGHLRLDFDVLLLFTFDSSRSKWIRNVDQKCPEKQEMKSKRDMKRSILHQGENSDCTKSNF